MTDRVTDLRLTPLKALELLREVERARLASEGHKNDVLSKVSCMLMNHVRWGLSRRKRG